MSDKFSDKFLLASSIAGDEQAFGQLYDKYVDEIYRFTVSKVRTQHQAQDLVAEVFLKTWQYVSRDKKQVDDFRALLYRITRNLIIDSYRASKKEFTTYEEDQLNSFVDESTNIALDAEHKDDMRVVVETLNKLSQEHQELISLRYIQDLSIKEIAHIQGKKNGAIRVALHRAVKQLKSILKTI